VRDATLVGFSMGGGEVVRYISRYEPTASPRPCWPAPSLYRSDDNPDGGLDDATIRQFQDGVRDDGIAFLDGFTTQFFTAGDDLLVRSPTGSTTAT
jgi:non-heme chloroperoxidase